MPAANLSNLITHDVLQLAVKLADRQVGLPAADITWLLDWAESLDAQTIKGLDRQQLFDLLQLLAAATTQDGSAQSSNRQPSSMLLGLLCWAVAEHVPSASGQQVYCLVKALADWRYKPPNGEVLLAAAAARVADKLPVLTQVQLSDVLCGFAALGFTVGEPLQGKFCEQLMQAAAAATAADTANAAGGSNGNGSGRMGAGNMPLMPGVPGHAAAVRQAGQTAEVLAAVLASIASPSPALVSSLMQQVDQKLHKLPASTLQKLGQGFAAAGMRVLDANANTAANDVSNVTGSSSASDAASSVQTIPMAWGAQFRTALVSCMYGMPLQELAAACSSLQRMELLADTATAESVVRALQPLLSAAAAAGGSSGSTGVVSASLLAPIVCYVTDSGFRPTAEVMTGVEQQLLAMMRGSSSGNSEHVVAARNISSSTGMESSAHPEEAMQHQGWFKSAQNPARLAPAELAQLLLVLNRWGRRPGADFGAAAYDWSRPRLQDCDAATLGPLLLGLCCICGRPSEGWLLDWAGTSAQYMQDAGPQDVAAMAAALAQAGSAAGSVGSNWWSPFSTAVLQCLQAMQDEDLENVCSSLYRLKHRPQREWLAAVLAEVQRRAPDSSQDTPASRALAWASQLRAAA